jgi:hypothetical protein
MWKEEVYQDMFRWLYENKITLEDLEDYQFKINHTKTMDKNDWNELLVFMGDVLDYMVECAKDNV